MENRGEAHQHGFPNTARPKNQRCRTSASAPRPSAHASCHRKDRTNPYPHIRSKDPAYRRDRQSAHTIRRPKRRKTALGFDQQRQKGHRDLHRANRQTPTRMLLGELRKASIRAQLKLQARTQNEPNASVLPFRTISLLREALMSERHHFTQLRSILIVNINAMLIRNQCNETIA